MTRLSDPVVLVAIAGAVVAAVGAIVLAIVELRRANEIIRRGRAIADAPAPEPEPEPWADGLDELDWSRA